MKMRNKRKALHRKYAGAEKVQLKFKKCYQGAFTSTAEHKQWMKDNPLVFED